MCICIYNFIDICVRVCVCGILRKAAYIFRDTLDVTSYYRVGIERSV